MSPLSELEFVLVSNDDARGSGGSGGVKKDGGKFIVAGTGEAARDCLNRRRIDGVFVDLEVPEALAVIEGIRKGASNDKAVIFACLADAKDNTRALSAGANFLLRKPLNVDSIAVHITIVNELMNHERRRYFRHAVNLPGALKEGEVEQHARMTNLSEGGMAVRTAKGLRRSSVMDFAFDLPQGTSVRGRGHVAWTNTEGMAGIILQIFHGKGREHLATWLTTQEQLHAKKNPPEK